MKLTVKMFFLQLFFLMCFHFHFPKASEEEILGAGSEPAEPDGVKTGNKEVEDLNEFVKIILK